MPRDSGGSYSLPAGNPVVTATTITSTWANTTLNDVASAMTDSLDRSGKGGMLGPLQALDGTSAAPGYTWATEQGSGLYRIGSNDFGFAVATNLVQEWKAAGIVITGFVHADASTGAAFAVGVRGVGADEGDGVQGQGGTTSGTGVTGFGGAPNGQGSKFVGAGTGYAVEVNTGHALFSGGNPGASDAFTNVQTPVNMVKAEFHILLNATSTPTLSAGFNVAASNPVTVSSSILTCSFNAPMAAATYVAQVTLDDFGATTLHHARVNVTSTGFVSIKIRDNTGALLDPAISGMSGQVIHVLVAGAQ